MTISRAKAIMDYFNDPDAGSVKPTMTEMKTLRDDKEAYNELAQLAALELGEELEPVKAS